MCSPTVSATNSSVREYVIPTADSATRRKKNKLAARKSRERRLAYVLHLELSLKQATERIKYLEAELRAERVESIVANMLDPGQMGMYGDN